MRMWPEASSTDYFVLWSLQFFFSGADGNSFDAEAEGTRAVLGNITGTAAEPNVCRVSMNNTECGWRAPSQ